MGGLYNMIACTCPIAGNILGWLGVQQGDVPRLRDAFLRDEGEHGLRFAILTRVGGGNREYYTEQIALLRQHPDYIRDHDDDFDSTYAVFEFRIADDTVRAEVDGILELLNGEHSDKRDLFVKNYGLEKVTDDAISRMGTP